MEKYLDETLLASPVPAAEITRRDGGWDGDDPSGSNEPGNLQSSNGCARP